MSVQESVIKAIARRYAVALFEVIEDTPSIRNEIAQHMDILGRLLETHDDLNRLLQSLIIEHTMQARAFDKVLEHAQFPVLLRNFVQVVLRNRRGFALSEITRQFADIIADARNEMTAYVRVARPLKTEQETAIKEKLEKISGKTIRIAAEIDPDLLGGFVVRVGTRLIDASLAQKLKSLQQVMNEAG